jgi:hypothetical protein
MPKDKEQKQPLRPPQKQYRRPGVESKMEPRPRVEDHNYRGGKLRDKPGDSSYMTGQILRPNGGEVING